MRAQVQVRLKDRQIAALAAKMGVAPEVYTDAMHAATEAAIKVEVAAIEANTPIRTGLLTSSWKTNVKKLARSTRGLISNKVRYVNFVERGTREHGRAQRMVARGVAASRPAVDAIYRQAVRDATEILK